MDKYYTYTFSDFINDDSFIRFVKYLSAEDEVVWNNWLLSEPVNLHVYEQARHYLLSLLTAATVVDSEANKTLVWNSIREEIKVQQQMHTRIIRIRRWGSIAAAAVCLVFAGVWYYNSRIEISTDFGEQKMVVMPDRSTIQLNSNSRLSYYRAWGWHARREVWLSGEGYFHVEHLNQRPEAINDKERFVAHAGKVNVEVLGTTFNLRYRRDEVLVALFEGKVSLTQTASAGQRVILLPDQAFQSKGNKLKELFIRQLENRPLAWTDKKMEVKGMTVAGIIEHYEDTYGGKIILDNPRLLRKQIDGTISLQTRESTLYMLANLLNATVEQQGDAYYLRSK